MWQIVKRTVRWLDLACFLIVAGLLAAYQPWNTRAIAGYALAALGFGLWLLARLQLGEAFSVKPQAKHLVTRGLYSKFRHPVYLFGEIAYVGLALAWGRWLGFAGVALAWLIQMLRMKKEDLILEKAFGEEYRRYRARTWF